MRSAKSLVVLAASLALLASPWLHAADSVKDQPLPKGPVVVHGVKDVPAPCDAGGCAASVTPACCPLKDPPCCPCIYGSVEALFWWIKNAQVPPLVTANADPNTSASLIEVGTVTLFGGAGRNADFPTTTGVRGTIGRWMPECVVGVEGCIFGLPDQGRLFTVSAGGGDGTVIAVPFNSLVPFNFNPAGETTLNPGNTASQISVAYSTMLWGADVNGMVNLLTSDTVRLIMIGGFKYLNLEEDLSVNQLFLDPLAAGTLTVRDEFGTRNQFFGAGLGVRAGLSLGPVGLDVGGKITIGPNRQQISAVGTTTAVGAPFGLAAGVTPAGLFAQQSNSGEYTRNAFTYVPEVQGRMTFSVCRAMKLWAA